MLTACGASVESTTSQAGEPAVDTSEATASTASTTAPTTTLPPESQTLETTTTSSPDETGVIVEIVIEAGVVMGEPRVEVALGEMVTLVVTSDTADEVHVHGYDLYLDLEPGVSAQLEFVADVPGIFEVELEDARLLLTDLEVGG